MIEKNRFNYLDTVLLSCNLIAGLISDKDGVY